MVDETTIHDKSLYLNGDIEEVEDIMPLINTLRLASEEDYIDLHITSWGGILSTALLLADAIIDSDATVRGIVHTAASGATLVAFACDELMLPSHATVMFHNFSVVQQGQAKKLRDKAVFDEKHFALLCNTFYTGVLTPEQIQRIQEDEDIWMTGREVNMQLGELDWTPVNWREANL